MIQSDVQLKYLNEDKRIKKMNIERVACIYK